MKKAFWIALVFFPLLLGAKISVNSPKQNTLPQLYFTPNVGQFSLENPSIAQAVIPGGAVFITQNGIRIRMDHPDDIGNKHQAHHYRGKDTQFSVRYHISDILFAGGQSPSKIQFLDPAPFYENYFLGQDPENWKSAVQPISKVILENIYPRIDVAIYFNNQNLEFDWILHPGADPRLIALKLDQSNQWKILHKQIHIQNSVGAFIIQQPIASQKNTLQKKSKPVNVSYSVDSQNLIRLNIAKYDPQQTLIIDPVLVFSTYSGSQGDNFGFTATYDTAGCLYAGGIVEADTRKYPVTTGAFQTTYGGSGSGAPPVQLPCDISISKYSSDGTKLLYATYMGGSDDEYPHSLCVDPNNNLLVFGTTLSADFPVHPDSAFNDIHQTDYDIFVNKLSVDGTTLLGGTFIGGNDADGFQTENPFTFLLYNYADNYRGDITTDPQGNVFIATCTRSTNFPCTSGALQTKPTGETDAAVICLNSQLSRIKWATLIGGLDDDAAYSIKVDDSSHVFVGGGTVSSDFPMTGKGFMQTGLGNIDGYIARFSQTTGAYQVGTYWGSIDYEQIYFIDLDINNKVYFTGQTEGKFKRTVGSYGKDNTTQFIGRLSNDLSKEEFITTFGNRTNSVPELCPSAFMVDNCYNIYFSGWGSVIGVGNNGTTNGLPITADAHQKTTDNHDFYLIVLGKDAKSLKYASYFGGNNSRDHVDGGTSRFDNRGIIYQSVCASCPNSPPGLNDFPTSPANVVFKNNVSIRCSNASFKLDFRLGYSIDAIFTVTPETVCLKSANAFQPHRKYDGSYLWDFGDGDTSHQFSPNHVYKDTGTYTVTLTVVDTNSCNARATFNKKIRVSIAPNGVCNIKITPCKPGVDFVFDINNYDSIIWDFGDGSKIERTGGVDLKKYFDGNGVLKRNYQYFAGQYEAKFVIKNRSSGCTDTLKIPVQVNTDSTHEVKIANVFTPNGDGKNDCFRVFGIAPDCEEAEIRIFNRWGERVYYSKDLSNCWNGKVNNTGPELPSGTYFYQLDIIKSPFMKTPKHVAGSANLIR